MLKQKQVGYRSSEASESGNFVLDYKWVLLPRDGVFKTSGPLCTWNYYRCTWMDLHNELHRTAIYSTFHSDTNVINT